MVFFFSTFLLSSVRSEDANSSQTNSAADMAMVGSETAEKRELAGTLRGVSPRGAVSVGGFGLVSLNADVRG